MLAFILSGIKISFVDLFDEILGHGFSKIIIIYPLAEAATQMTENS